MASDPQDRRPQLREEKGNRFIPPKDRREERSVHVSPDLDDNPSGSPDPIPVTGDNPHPGAHGNPVDQGHARTDSGTVERTVIAVFERREHCEDAVVRLVDEGRFEKDQMSLMVTDGMFRDIHEDEFQEFDVDRIQGERPSADEIGGAFGQLIANLASLGPTAFDENDSVYATGPLYAAAATAAQDEDRDRALELTLQRTGVTPEHADQQIKMIRDGALLLAVHPDDAQGVSRAREILEDCEVMEVFAEPPLR